MTSWIVDVTFDGDPSLEPAAIAKLLDNSWRDQFGDATVFGRDADSGRWTFLIAADGPNAVDRLKIGFDYVNLFDPDDDTSDPAIYQARLNDLPGRLTRFGRSTVTAAVSPQAAGCRAAELRNLLGLEGLMTGLVLQAPAGLRYDGRTVWDVMLCLGMRWGDMDCFHWDNKSEFGNDYLLTVETSTPPGYFLPKWIAAGQLHVDDLVFHYSIPRSPSPVEVFDAMARAVQYAQSRLGGTILDEHRRPADLEVIRRVVAQTEARLRAEGFEPGSDAALRLF